LVVAILAVVSMTYGNLATLAQTNVVRLLAYSSIAQAGYFLLGVVGIGHGALAMQSLIVFAAAYAAMNLGAFAIVARVGRDLDAFTGLLRASPWRPARPWRSSCSRSSACRPWAASSANCCCSARRSMRAIAG